MSDNRPWPWGNGEATPSLLPSDELVAQYRTAFDAVCDKADWKAPVNAVVPAERLAITVEAIEFFTATPCEVRVEHGGAAALFRVKSIGYRAGPAGP